MNVSVLIPTCNKQQELRRCLEAVLAQDFSGSFEVLVCDDGSQDGTTEMLGDWQQSEPRLRYFRQEQRGPAAVRNLGLRHAAGDFVAMTDDDTIPQPGWLERLVAAASRPGACGAEGRVTSGRPLGPAETAPTNESGGVYLTCNVAYRREVLARIGGFDERFPFAAFEDCDLAARVEQHGEIVWAPDAVVLHPPRPLTWPHTLRRLRHWPWITVTARRYGYFGWPRYATRHPRARAIWKAVVKLPAGRLLSALRAFPSHPIPALRAAAWALAEPFVALFRAVPPLLSFDLDSAALYYDYLDLQPATARVGVVIVHYQQPDLLDGCLRSFQQVTTPPLDLIVVDNGGDAAAVERLRAAWPAVDWIAAETNTGYTGGNNLGIARALEGGCEYVLLVNADTECIEPGFVGRLVRFLELNPDVALAGPRVYLRRRGEIQNTILRYPALFRQLVDWFGYRLFPAGYERSGGKVRSVEMLNGVCILLRASALRQVGAFDPRYFMYIEDADLALRLRQAGWRLAYVPVDSVIHHQKESGYDLEGEVSLLLRRNAVYFLQKHHRRAQAWGLAAANLLLAVARTVVALPSPSFERRKAFCGALWREFRAVLGASPPPPADPRDLPARS
jgi:GT2 family glycosyltransferase